MVATKFVSENANIDFCGEHQAVDRLDGVLVVDKCPANLVVHQVVDFTRIVLAGVEENALVIHGWVSLRQVTESFEAAIECFYSMLPKQTRHGVIEVILFLCCLIKVVIFGK